MERVRKVGIYKATKLADGQYQLRWRLYLADGRAKAKQDTFARKGLLDRFVERLTAAGNYIPDVKDGFQWGWNENYDLVPLGGDDLVPAEGDALPATDTLWALIRDWRRKTWKTGSGNGRKNAAIVLRHMVRFYADDDIPAEAEAYLAGVAFRGARERTIDDLRKDYPEGVVPYYLNRKRHTATIQQMERGRQWLVAHSPPTSALTADSLQDFVDYLGAGRSGGSEATYWSTGNSMLHWGMEADRVPPGITSGLNVRSNGTARLQQVSAVPTEAEMWQFAWALMCRGTERSLGRWAALPILMGGAGLRIGECAALQRMDTRDDTESDGMWITVAKTLATPGRAWTDSGEQSEQRGPKAKGPLGRQEDRSTYLPPKESELFRTHLAQFVGPQMTAHVFTGVFGARLQVSHLQRDIWKPARELAYPAPHRLANLNRHSFRHLAVTRWLRKGVPLTTAARWGGWKTVSVMVNFYDSVMPNDDEYAAALMAHP